MVYWPSGFPRASTPKKTPENHICYISDNQQSTKVVPKKYVLKHKKVAEKFAQFAERL